MQPVRKITLWSLITGAALFLGGCQANGTQPAAIAEGDSDRDVASTQAVHCDKCKVTYVKVPVHGGKSRVVGYRSEKRMECPDCKSAAENFFATGKWQHTCKTCGDAVEICKAH